MAMETHSISFEELEDDETATPNLITNSKTGVLSSRHMVKINYADGTIASTKVGKLKKNCYSPYLTEDVQLISQFTEKSVLRKKPPFMSSFPLAAHIYKASSDEFKGLCNRKKKVKKSVLTLPNNPAPKPQACTVSDLSEREYSNMNANSDYKKAKKPRPYNHVKKRRNFDYYDRDAHYCSQLNIDLDCSSTDTISHNKGGGKKLVGGKVTDENVDPHHVWAVLRNINRFQFRPTPPMSEESNSPKKKKCIRRRNNQKNLRLVERCCTEEIEYTISHFEVDNQDSISRSSSFDRITVINNEIGGATLKTKLMKSSPKNQLLNKTNVKKLKAPVMTKSKETPRSIQDLSQGGNSVDVNATPAKVVPSELGTIKVIHNEDYLTVADADRESTYTRSSKAELESVGSQIDRNSNGQSFCGITKLVLAQSPTETKNVIPLINDKNIKPENVKPGNIKPEVVPRNRVRISPSAVYTPKLTKTDISRRLMKMHFPILITPKDQVFSNYQVISTFPQFNGLDEQIWPFMIQWHKENNPAEEIVLQEEAPQKPLEIQSIPTDTRNKQIDTKYKKSRDKKNIEKVKSEVRNKSSKHLSLPHEVFSDMNKPNLSQFKDKMLRLLYKSANHKNSEENVSATLKKSSNNSICINMGTNTEVISVVSSTNTSPVYVMDEKRETKSKCTSPIPPFMLSNGRSNTSSVINKNTSVIGKKNASPVRYINNPVRKRQEESPVKNRQDGSPVNATRGKFIRRTVKTKSPLTYKDNEHPSKIEGNAGINWPGGSAKRKPKSKWASEFLDNIFRKIKNGVYYTLDSNSAKTFPIKNLDSESQTEPTVANKDSPHSISKIVIKKKYDPPNFVIPGFDENDNLMPKFEIKSMNLNELIVKTCADNILLRFDLMNVMHEPKTKRTPSLIPLDVTESHTKIFKCKTIIKNAMLPAEICSILPKLVSCLLDSKSNFELTTSGLDKQMTPLATIQEGKTPVPSDSSIPMCIENIGMSEELRRLQDGGYHYVPKVNELIPTTPKLPDTCLIRDILPELGRSHMFDINVSLIFPIPIENCIPLQQNQTTVQNIEQVTTCTALQVYPASSRRLVPTYNKFSWWDVLGDLSKKISSHNVVIKNMIEIPTSITITLMNTKSQGLQADVLVNFSGLDEISKQTVWLNQDINPDLKRNNGYSLEYITMGNKDVPSINTTSTPPKAKFVNHKIRNPKFLKLYRRCKPSSKVVRVKAGTPIRSIKNLDEFFISLGSTKLLAGVCDGYIERKIMSSLEEMKKWTSKVTPKQGFLVLLLMNKKDTSNLVLFRSVLLQGIAVNRITRLDELDLEIEVIEREYVKKTSALEGISYLPGSLENQDILLEELIWIAKNTASDYQVPFDEVSEKLLKSLVAKRKQLNPSYLRVMARYVGLGLLKMPKKTVIID